MVERASEVLSVNYAGLPSSPWYALGQKYAPNGTGAVLAFEIDGGVEAGKAFVEALGCTATWPTSVTCAAS